MKNIFVLIICSIVSTSLIATNEVAITKHKSFNSKTDQKQDDKQHEKSDKFGTLKKANLRSNNKLGIGNNNLNAPSQDTDICSVADDSDNGLSDGTGLCGVPEENNNEKELKNNKRINSEGL